MPHAIRRRVLLVLGWYDYRLHSGIEKYAQERGWHLSKDVVREKVIPWGWEGDGILAWLGAGDDLADFVAKTGKPTVDFSFRRSHLGFDHVLENTAETAQLVGEHFLSRGLREFLFYSDASNWIYDERGEAFREFLRSRQSQLTWLRWHECSDFRIDRKAWKKKRVWLAEQLKSFPKPFGLFAATDELALEAMEVCEDADITVPEEVAIVGAGNSLLAVDAMHTPISSVEVNMESIGYRGAKLLDDLMARRSRKQPQIIRISPNRLIVRKSSDLTAVNHPGIARSLRFMRDHYHEAIGIPQLAKVASMSMRNFHQAFRNNLGRTPGTELNRVRMQQAKKLLTGTDIKVHTVAEMCGYEIDNSFCVAFKRATGIAPRQFSKQYRQAKLKRFPSYV